MTPIIVLLALTNISTTTPFIDNLYQKSVDLTFQARTLLNCNLDGDIYSVQNSYAFHTHLEYNNENDFSIHYQGVTIYSIVYDDSQDIVYQTEGNFYLENSIVLDQYSNFSLTYSRDNTHPTWLIHNFDFGSYSDYYYLDMLNADTILLTTPQYSIIWLSAFDNVIPQVLSSDSYNIGYDGGYDSGYNAGRTEGYNTGYADGYSDGSAGSGEPAVIFGGILNVALLPVNFFLAILNFEVFGINIGGFVTGLMTLAVIVILFGVIFGGRPSPGGGKK